MKYKSLLGAALLAGALAGPSSAGQCGYDYCWGTVAYNPNTGHYGWSVGQWSQVDAENAAQEGCNYNCTEFKSFYNQCGAVALGNNGGSGWGFGLSRAAAQNTAMNYCTQYDYGCQVLVWACSP